MKISMRHLLIPVLLLAVSAIPAAADEVPDLNGEWVLNKEASDDPDAVMRPARAGSGGDGMGRGGGMGRGSGGRGGRGSRGSSMGGGGRPAGGEGDGNPGGRLLERYGTLSVFHEADDLDLTDGMNISRLLHVDGKAEKVWTERGQVMATAQWLDDELEVLWQGGGGERTSRYTLSEDGEQLVVTEEFLRPGSDDKVRLRLVYDRSGGALGPTSK